jgi:hypothetical protein
MTLDSGFPKNEWDIAVFSFAVFPFGFAGSPTYSSSETSEDTDVWIQPPISRQAFDLSGSVIIDGTYVRVEPPEIAPVVEPGLAWELEAWEAASDEALMLFEAECD